MNIQSKSRQLADEIGKPENAPFIEAQLLRKSFEANRAAIDRSLSFERARLSAVSLSHDEQIALASYIVDNLDGVDPDDRNAAVDAIGLLA
jgi:hypothetical protein